MIHEPIGKLTKRYYYMNYKWQNNIDRAEEYADKKFIEHKERQSNLYQKAYFEVWHNHCYDNLSEEKFDELVKKEFIYIYTEKMVWKDIHKSRRNDP